MLQVKQCAIATPASTLFTHLDFEVKPGEILTLMGPSGCGKSSLLHWLAGCLPDGLTATGEIWLNQRRCDTLPTEARRIGLIFQDDLLFPHFSVGQNLALAIPAGVTRGERKAQALAALGCAELGGFYHRDPATLSGGQRARVSVLRALLAQPDALLLDEPFSRLDPGLRAAFRAFVWQQVAARPVPVVLVTHDPMDCPDTRRLIQLPALFNSD